MNKKCVYTVITGEYDLLKNPKVIDKDIDYICFTNNKNIKSDIWKIKYLDEDIDNQLLARKVKILGPSLYVSKYPITLFVDSAFQIINSVDKYFDKYCDLGKYDIVGIKHEERDCIYDEANAVVKYNRDSKENVDKLMKYYKKEGYPKHNGLIASGILVRKNTKEVLKLMDSWWKMLNKWTRRDQLSFNYCIWKYPVPIKYVDFYYYDNKYFKHDFHHNKINVQSRRARVYFGNYDSFDYNNYIDIDYSNESLTDGIRFKVMKDVNQIYLLFNNIGDNIDPKSIRVSTKCKINYNIHDIYGCGKMFLYDSVIILEGDFKKGSIINVSLKVLGNDREALLNKIDTLNENIKVLKKHIYDLEIMNEEKSKIINSSNKSNILFRIKKKMKGIFSKHYGK